MRTAIANGIDVRVAVVALEKPIVQGTNLKTAIGDQIQPGVESGNPDIDVVDQAFTGIEQIDLQRVPVTLGTAAVIERAVDGERGPEIGTFGRFVAVAPVGREPVVAVRI